MFLHATLLFLLSFLLLPLSFCSNAQAVVTPQISAGKDQYGHTIALKSDGTLWAWGGNGAGGLGIGPNPSKNSPVQVGSDTNWVSISAGFGSGAGHTHALKSDGTLWAWGWNVYGQLGDGTNTQRNSPVQIGSDNKWVSISAGSYHTLALKSDGTLWAWGVNDSGQLGDGTGTRRNSPGQIGSDNKWASISAGASHTIALKSDGTLWAWGGNVSGQLGDGTNTQRYSPVQIMHLRYPEDCTNGIDDDDDGLVDCDDPECCGNAACFTNPGCPIKTETLLSRQAVMSNVEVTAPDFNGTSTLNFTGLEFVKITTGSFAEKGFSKGTCEATFEGATYTGEWRGVTFLKPSEKKVYLKGAVTGQINATVEGDLTESVPNSGDYDKYKATWQIGRLANADASATINVNGTISYGDDTEYPDTQLYLLQANIETTPSGDYDPDTLNTVLTHIRVVKEDSPYVGEGFSIISYNSKSGSGQGWTYDRLRYPGAVEMKGLFSSPLYGIASATLDDSNLPRNLSLRIERIDLGIPPMADLEVKTWGPQRVNPGQTVNYVVEYRNDGVVNADDAVVILQLPAFSRYVSSTGGGIYRWETHEVFWKLGSIPPQSIGNVSVNVQVDLGLKGSNVVDTFAMYGTTSLEKDYYLSTDKEPLFALQDYLNYQPLEITSNKALTPEEFANELSSDVQFNDLYQYAIELGYSDLIAKEITISEGATLIQVLMSNSSNESLFLNKVNDTSFLMKYTEKDFSLINSEKKVLHSILPMA